MRNEIEQFLKMKAPNTRKGYLLAWNAWIEWLGDKDPTPQVAMEYVRLLKERYAPLTAEMKINAIKSLYAILKGLEVLSRNPFEIVYRYTRAKSPLPIKPHKAIPFESVKLILDACDGKKRARDRAMVAIMFGTGLRRSEIANLNIEDVKITKNGVPYLYLAHHKTGGQNNQPVPVWAWECLNDWFIERLREGRKEKDPLFYGWPGHRIDHRTVNRIFQRACLKVGIEASAHDARATVATLLKSIDVHDRDVARVLRHKGEEMVRVYDKRGNVAEKLAHLINYPGL